MTRKKFNKSAQVTPTPITVESDFDQNESVWFVEQAKAHNLQYLLAYADDGLIWGEVRGDNLILSSDAFDNASPTPTLQAVTLQQARLFGEEAEVMIWRTEQGFIARLLTEKDSAEPDYLEESYLLWGTQLEKESNGFFQVVEGKRGLKHAPPIKPKSEKTDKDINRLSLTMRHYLAYDEDGQAYIKTSRLVTLNNNGGDYA